MEALFGQAVQRQLAGDLAGALGLYGQVLRGAPDWSPAWANTAAALHRLGKGPEALMAARRAVDLAPEAADARNTLGAILAASGDLAGAEVQFRTALGLEPRQKAALTNLSELLTDTDRFGEAVDAACAGLVLDPRDPMLHLDRGTARLNLGLLSEAEADFLAALAAEPGMPKARWNLAYLRLLQGRYREAWPDFGARLQVPRGRAEHPGHVQPLWDGGPLEGRTILVWTEQGLGDTLQFARYLPWVQARGGRVLFQVQPALRCLVDGLAGADRVLSTGEALPPFDLQAPLMDLPALSGSTPEDLPPPAPIALPAEYEPPPLLAGALEGPGPKVGLAWAGNPLHQNDARRSLDPALLAPLGSVAGVRWFSLQRDARSLPPLPGLVDLAPGSGSLADTAWALSRLDLLVTVDTALAHLAGSLGVPARLLVAFLPDWRWILGREDTPWYPSLRLHRQPAPGDWAPVVASVAESLASLALIKVPGSRQAT